jgi:hypothetical protein
MTNNANPPPVIADVSVHIAGDAPWSMVASANEVVLTSPRRTDSFGAQTGVKLHLDRAALAALGLACVTATTEEAKAAHG